MTYFFQNDFQRRRSQVKRYFAVVSSAERRLRLSGAKQIETDRLHVLRAGTFLILYNLVEASSRAALQEIHDTMAAQRVPFAELNIGIRREVIKGFKRNGDPDTHVIMADLPVDFVSASLDVEYHFSGNVDAKLIRGLAMVYGFSSTTDNSITRGGNDLLTVKNLRNDLAHGDKTYDEVGRSHTTRDLLEIGVRTIAYVSSILDNVAKYLDEQGYRSDPDPSSMTTGISDVSHEGPADRKP